MFNSCHISIRFVHVDLIVESQKVTAQIIASLLLIGCSRPQNVKLHQQLVQLAVQVRIMMIVKLIYFGAEFETECAVSTCFYRSKLHSKVS